MPLHLDHPFSGQPKVTQQYGPTTVDAEPNGYWYAANREIDYYHATAGAQGPQLLHCGIDYALSYGTPLHACADGKVIFNGHDQTGFGLCLKIEHEGGVVTLFAHQSEIKVNVGQQVKRGEVVSLSGGAPQYAGDPRPGNSNGAHLHFSVIAPDGRYTDPQPFLTVPKPPPGPEKSKPPKPAGWLKHASFSVKVSKGGARIWPAPDTTLGSPLHDLAEGVTLKCVAWVYGEPRWDETVNQWDSRWYYSPDRKGFIASARCDGNAPGSRPTP